MTSWRNLILACVTLVVMTILAGPFHEDTAAILALITGAMSAVLLPLKDQTNGNWSRLLDIHQSLVRSIAAAHVPTNALPPGPATAQPTAPDTPPVPDPTQPTPPDVAAAGPTP